MSYRIKHIPTGLYFMKSRVVKNAKGNYVKSNLSTKGRTYRDYPSLAWCTPEIYTHIGSLKADRKIQATIHDWVVESSDAVIKEPPTTYEAAIEHAFDAMIQHIEERIGTPPPAMFLTNARHGFRVAVETLDKLRKDFNLDGAL